MTRVPIGKVKAKGIALIKDKDGNIKGELEIVSVEFQPTEQLKEDTEDATDDDKRRN